MKNLRDRIFVGRNFKLQAALFGVVAFAMAVFIYGIFNFTDAPFKPCAGGHYCGKTGVHHTYEEYQAFRQWELVLIACWPFAMIASYALSKLRKPLP